MRQVETPRDTAPHPRRARARNGLGPEAAGRRRVQIHQNIPFVARRGFLIVCHDIQAHATGLYNAYLLTPNPRLQSECMFLVRKLSSMI